MPNEPEFPTTLENRNEFLVDDDTAPDGSFVSTSVITINPAVNYDGNNDRAVIVDGAGVITTIVNKGTPTYIKVAGLNITKPLLFDGNAPVYLLVENFLNIGADVGCSSKCKEHCWSLYT